MTTNPSPLRSLFKRPQLQLPGGDLNSFTEFPICHRTAFPTNQASRPLYPGERSLTSSRLRHRSLSFPHLFFPEALLPGCVGYFDNSFDTLIARDGAVSQQMLCPPPLHHALTASPTPWEIQSPSFPSQQTLGAEQGWERGLPKPPPPPSQALGKPLQSPSPNTAPPQLLIPLTRSRASPAPFPKPPPRPFPPSPELPLMAPHRGQPPTQQIPAHPTPL